MLIRIDDSKCEGHGRCYSLAPDLFEPDDVGNAVVTGGDGTVAEVDEALARRAAMNCPEQAVVIEEDS